MTSTFTRRSALGLGAAALSALALPTPAGAAPATTGPATAAPAGRPGRTRLTNLAHLDFLTDRVAVTRSAAHDTYRIDRDPRIGVVWVYADARPGNTFERVGGGAYDAATNTWGQGAYDSDDMTRAAVVYLREWRATGSEHARQQAYQQLRGVAYFQTLTGPSAGNGVLWMQPDGSFNATPTPPDDPDPADSATSYWTARTVWAYGEGYAAFRRSDPAFARFLADRMLLTVRALERDVLVRYGRYQVIHGVRVPAWLIVDGADATSEAVLGLAAYVAAGGPQRDRVATALRRFSRGLTEMAAGSTTSWPFRAILPWGLSRSDWHAWGAQMPTALAAASQALRDRSLLPAAIGDAAGFTPQLLTSTGPVNGLLPTPGDRTQIAYGTDARVQTAVAVGRATGRPAITALAGIAASWYFGGNAAGVPVYDPQTGWTADGVAADGTVNRNGGAESTIHGLLSMQVLDAHPDLAELARAAAGRVTTDGLQVLEAEAAEVGGTAAVVTPDPAWTGESLWSGGAVALGSAGTIRWDVPADDQPRWVQPVVALRDGATGRATVTAGPETLGRFGFDVGPQGEAPSADALLPIALRSGIGAAATAVQLSGDGGTVDALQVMPEIALRTAGTQDRGVWLFSSRAAATRTRPATLPTSATAWVADRDGRTVRQLRLRAGAARIPVLPGGFTLVVGQHR